MNVPKSSLEVFHYPVMMNEVIKICSPKDGGTFVDCTFGGGSYSEEILKFSNTKVIAIDRDKKAQKKAALFQKKYPKRFFFFNEKFSNLNKILKNKKVDSIIFDLGVSSFQLMDMERGFSFKSKSKIDMSMGLTSISAENILNNFDEHKLKLIIKILGDEQEASKIARNIIKIRNSKMIVTVPDLVDIIEKSKKKDFKKKINICTKTFQALRIFINKEITELINGIIHATKFIKPGGKIIIISFHSIEDKIVKSFFSTYAKDKSRPSRYEPEDTNNQKIFFENYKNSLIIPTKKEIDENPPSRSAKLRFVTRNNEEFYSPVEFIKKFRKYLELESTNA